MKFIKASERLPDKTVHAKNDGVIGIITVFDNFFEFSGRGFFHSYTHKSKDLSKIEWLDETREDGEWISVHDNSDGFRDYLDLKGIEYKRNGHFTMVKKDVNLYWLGRQVEEWKQLQKIPSPPKK